MIQYWHKLAWIRQLDNFFSLIFIITLQTFIYAVTIVHNNYFNLIMTPEAERFNGWAAMLGFVAAVGAYVTTGQIIPGWF